MSGLATENSVQQRQNKMFNQSINQTCTILTN